MATSKSKSPAKNATKPAAYPEKNASASKKSTLKTDIQNGYKELVEKARTAITKKLYSGATAILEDLLEKLNEKEKQANAGTAKAKAPSNQPAPKTTDGNKQVKTQEPQKAVAKQGDKKSSGQSGKPSAQEAPNKKSASSSSDKKQAKPQANKTARVSHGKDMHFIPQKNQQHLIKGKEKLEVEKAYEHNEEIALHQEQQKAKNNLATRQKRIFVTPRQS